MNEELLKLEPKALWANFVKLTQIPRPSKKEAKVIEFMKNFGESLGLETIVDEVGNVIIRKPATPGMENRKGVILQGHLDMVPQKNSDKDHDFEKDPIEAYVDGEWVTANGTTLGADNGIGVAAAMAILESKDIEHGPIEALFTIDEETGMTGAFGLKPGLLKGDILLNMDSEDEGELYVGCAGGMDTNVEFEYKKEEIPAGYKPYKLIVKGLKGGHSGLDINLGRGNANIIMARLLLCIEDFGIRVADFEGGNLRNAIPREAFATVLVPEDKVTDFEKHIKVHEQIQKAELEMAEPDLIITAEPTDMPCCVMDIDTHKKFARAVYVTPNGVIRMSDSMPGLVETSTNLAIVKAKDGKVNISCLLRSSVDTAKKALGKRIQSLYELIDAKVWFSGEYPGWKPNMDSEILKTMQNVYQTKFGKIPEIKAIHAGLECGLLGGVYTHWDMISFGPTIRFPHSPDEKVHIESVKKFWDYLVETLKNIPVKE